jgi:hypothetical protein
MEHLGDVGQVEARLVRWETVLISAQDKWALKSFWEQPMKLLGDVGQVDVCFGTFGDSVILDAR